MLGTTAVLLDGQPDSIGGPHWGSQEEYYQTPVGLEMDLDETFSARDGMVKKLLGITLQLSRLGGDHAPCPSQMSLVWSITNRSCLPSLQRKRGQPGRKRRNLNPVSDVNLTLSIGNTFDRSPS